MITSTPLLTATKRLVRDLSADIRAALAANPADQAAVQAEFERARAVGRTGLSRHDWEEGWIAQGAVAWVLGCVFVRFCEDNGLVDEPLLSGPGTRLALARDQRSAYLLAHPSHDDRHWLREVFGRYQSTRGVGPIFGPANPVWLVSPSADGARELVQFWWALADDANEIRFDFTDPSLDTRFLGDLYQDLSDHAKKTYALLQTPVFVEEFILDRTLDPAIATFGLATVRLIDPTCGSGHFLLGAFDRLLDRWLDAEPGTDVRTLVSRALDAVHGVDLNPFAVAVARFRLLVRAMRAEGIARLRDAPEHPIHVATGDSLLHGQIEGRLTGTLDDDTLAASTHGYSSEDVDEARRILSEHYHAVVGNPPYITVKDPALNQRYRDQYTTCKGKYSLGVPFTERFWTLAMPSPDQPAMAGFVGMITANSFMKREMGSKLIEQWLPHRDLTHLIDTSGAYIPGHGTPTVILFGRNRAPVNDTVRAVMGIRGEPSRPADAAKGLVWSSIVELVDTVDQLSAYVSTANVARSLLARHPWSIGGGGAAELKERLEVGNGPLLTVVDAVGVTAISGEDDAYLRSDSHFVRYTAPRLFLRPLIEGDLVRDWDTRQADIAIFPYDTTSLIPVKMLPRVYVQELWPFRTRLWNRTTFSKQTYRAEGRTWHEWHQTTLERLRTPLSIVFADVATHNHFVLDRGGKVFNRTAPVIKLPAGAGEDDHLALLGVLNSSTACFWMKQVCFPKGGDSVGSEGARIRKTWWDERFAHDATKLKQFPLPRGLSPTYGRLLDGLAQELAATTPSAVAERAVPTRQLLDDARRRYLTIRAQMICAQEESDWHAYRLYGLIGEDLTFPIDRLPDLALGERAFEIVLARAVAEGDEETSWFTRHGSTPITEPPAHWPSDYRDLVQRRIGAIEANPEIALIERPEYKRRWNTDSWEKQESAALRSWLLDRLESPRYWSGDPALTTVARIAASARLDADLVQIAALYQGVDDPDLLAVVDELVRAEAVPYLAALRYTEEGLRKHAQWQEVWRLQREEDATGTTFDIPVPPKYAKTDFQGVAWTHRGKLDVPKERFISYPGAERDGDATLVVGWAGWDHLARARALASWFIDAESAGPDRERVLWPMLAGLQELVPWLLQWHNEPDPSMGGERAGEFFRSFVDTSARANGTSPAELAALRIEPPRTRTRRKRS